MTIIACQGTGVKRLGHYSCTTLTHSQHDPEYRAFTGFLRELREKANLTQRDWESGSISYKAGFPTAKRPIEQWMSQNSLPGQKHVIGNPKQPLPGCSETYALNNHFWCGTRRRNMDEAEAQISKTEKERTAQCIPQPS